MAKKKKAPETVQSEYKDYGVGRVLDKSSFLAGAVGGALIIALIVLAYVASQQVGEEIIAAHTPPQPAPEPEKFTGGIQVTVRNNENKSIAISSGSAGELTLTLKPGASQNTTVMPPRGCGADIAQCRGEITVTYLVLYSSSGNDTGSSNQTGWNGGNGNETGGGGNQAAGGGASLSISTQQLASAVQDAKYSFALEAEGGTGSYYWSATGFPLGLSMSNNGLISGAALEKGTFSIQVVLSDGASTVVSDMVLRVD